MTRFGEGPQSIGTLMVTSKPNQIASATWALNGWVIRFR